MLGMSGGDCGGRIVRRFSDRLSGGSRPIGGRRAGRGPCRSCRQVRLGVRRMGDAGFAAAERRGRCEGRRPRISLHGLSWPRRRRGVLSCGRHLSLSSPRKAEAATIPIRRIVDPVQACIRGVESAWPMRRRRVRQEAKPAFVLRSRNIEWTPNEREHAITGFATRRSEAHGSSSISRRDDEPRTRG